MCQSTNCSKYTSLVSDAGNGEGCAHVGAGNIWKISVPFFLFFREIKTVLKNKLKKKRKKKKRKKEIVLEKFPVMSISSCGDKILRYCGPDLLHFGGKKNF